MGYEPPYDGFEQVKETFGLSDDELEGYRMGVEAYVRSASAESGFDLTAEEIRQIAGLFATKDLESWLQQYDEI